MSNQDQYYSVSNPLNLMDESDKSYVPLVDDSPFTPGNVLESRNNSVHELPIDNVTEEVIIVDKDDEENFRALTEWLLKKADIIPSLTRKYSQIFLNEGVGSVSRLHKRVKKDHDFLVKVGIKEDDVEEIILALNR